MKKLVILVLLFFTQVGNADWSLCNKVSNLNFITSQNEKLTEVHSFSNMEGTISNQGNVLFKVDLSSVETHNSLRNIRLQEFLFETSKFQEATASINLDTDFLDELEFDIAKEIVIQVTLDLHGVTKEISTPVLVTRLKNNCLLVSTVKPIVFSLKDFGLLAGLEKLRQLAKLDSISNTVSVSLNLFFRSNATI